MTDNKTPQNVPFSARIAATRDRLSLSEAQAADYLGVPVFTLRKWSTGERVPAAVAVRLLDVLEMLEALAPALHAGLIPEDRKRKKKAL